MSNDIDIHNLVGPLQDKAKYCGKYPQGSDLGIRYDSMEMCTN